MLRSSIQHVLKSKVEHVPIIKVLDFSTFEFGSLFVLSFENKIFLSNFVSSKCVLLIMGRNTTKYIIPNCRVFNTLCLVTVQTLGGPSQKFVSQKSNYLFYPFLTLIYKSMPVFKIKFVSITIYMIFSFQGCYLWMHRIIS